MYACDEESSSSINLVLIHKFVKPVGMDQLLHNLPSWSPGTTRLITFIIITRLDELHRHCQSVFEPGSTATDSSRRELVDLLEFLRQCRDSAVSPKLFEVLSQEQCDVLLAVYSITLPKEYNECVEW